MKLEFFTEESEKEDSDYDNPYENSHEGENLLLNYLNSRYLGLTFYHQHANKLLEQIRGSSKDQNYTVGLAMKSRLPYWRQLDSKKVQRIS